MRLFFVLLLISGTCFASTDTKVLLDNAAQCAAMKDLKGTKVNCPPAQKQKANQDIEILSEAEMAAIEDEMGPPPAALPEGEDLVLE